jgi:hypothetical protein
MFVIKEAKIFQESSSLQKDISQSRNSAISILISALKTGLRVQKTHISNASSESMLMLRTRSAVR